MMNYKQVLSSLTDRINKRLADTGSTTEAETLRWVLEKIAMFEEIEKQRWEEIMAEMEAKNPAQIVIDALDGFDNFYEFTQQSGVNWINGSTKVRYIYYKKIKNNQYEEDGITYAFDTYPLYEYNYTIAVHKNTNTILIEDRSWQGE